MRKATSLRVEGDWTFGKGVEVIGEVTLEASSAQRVDAGTVLSDGESETPAGGPTHG